MQHTTQEKGCCTQPAPHHTPPRTDAGAPSPPHAQHQHPVGLAARKTWRTRQHGVHRKPDALAIIKQRLEQRCQQVGCRTVCGVLVVCWWCCCWGMVFIGVMASSHSHYIITLSLHHTCISLSHPFHIPCPHIQLQQEGGDREALSWIKHLLTFTHNTPGVLPIHTAWPLQEGGMHHGYARGAKVGKEL